MCLPEGERDRERAMALEAVVFPQSQDPFGGYGSVKDFYNCTFLAATSPNWGDYEHININIDKEEEQGSISTFLDNNNNNPYGGDWTSSSSSILPHFNELQETTDPSNTTLTTRPKRRRAKSRKNKEEIENQRMTHIAVERNRRKQMNEYLSVLRSLMPDSYIQRVYFAPLPFVLTCLFLSLLPSKNKRLYLNFVCFVCLFVCLFGLVGN